MKKVKSYTAKQIFESMVVALRNINNHKLFLPFGVEMEFFVFKDGKPVNLCMHKDVLQEMHMDLKKILWPGSGKDIGNNMMELAFMPVSSIHDYTNNLKEVFGWLAKNKASQHWRFVFTDNPDNSLGWEKNERYMAIVKASTDPLLLLNQMTTFGAFQINIGVEKIGGIFSYNSKRLLYILNNIAPLLAVNAEWHSRNEQSQRLPNAFKGFAEKSRLPHYMEWSEVENLEETLLKIPHFIKQNGKGLIPATPNDFPQNIQEVNTGTIWWDSRIRDNETRSTERVEFRALTTMAPHWTPTTLIWFNKIIKKIVIGSINADIPKYVWQEVRNKTPKSKNLAKKYLKQNNLWLPCEPRVQHLF